MTRRGLLRLLGAGLIGHTLDVDKLLWVPGQKTIFLPPVASYTRLETMDKVLREYYLPGVRRMLERENALYTLMMAEGIAIKGR